jgi:hypothetical protein
MSLDKIVDHKFTFTLLKIRKWVLLERNFRVLIIKWLNELKNLKWIIQSNKHNLIT